MGTEKHVFLVSIPKSVIEKRSGWVIEKTMSKAERAWFLDCKRGERSLYPSGISSLGKSRVFSKHPA